MVRYVTRWALSTGIRIVDGEYTEDGKYFHSRKNYGGIFVAAREASETLELAQEEARRMAVKKVASLKKQIKQWEDPIWRADVIDTRVQRDAG